MTEPESRTTDPENHTAQARFSTFSGVFTPCALTIMGVIMFMRIGYVTGYTGMGLALLILIFAKVITTLTTLSISAIVTNLDMRVGGVYFMISRVLGPDFGGSIGITLFIANSIGVAFYIIGFTEAISVLFGVSNPILHRLISTSMLGFLFYLSFRSADIAIKAQFVILGILLLAVVSMLVGGIMEFEFSRMLSNTTMSRPLTEMNAVFWGAFAIFFPAATGITAGANLSGDLKNPRRSIPRGTLLAIGFTAVIYGIQIVLLAGSDVRENLIENGYPTLLKMSLFSPLVVLGVFAATLSSALGCLLGGPRILQAMGQDRLMRIMVFFGKGEGDTNEPRRATLLTFCIALVTIWAGSLNAVAEVITMFFLITYGMINLAAFVESRSGNPSFRPTFRVFHWTTALTGAICCGVAMMKINDTYALIALGITGLIYFYLKKSNVQTSFGDAKRGYIFQRTKDNLLYLEGTRPHPKNWRPIMVTLCDDPETEQPLIQAAGWLESGRGLLTVAQVLERPQESISQKLQLRADREREISRILKTCEVKAFSQCIVSNHYVTGLLDFMQSYAIGALRPNSFLISIPPPEDTSGRDRFFQKIDLIASFNYNLAILKPGTRVQGRQRRRIDLWWRGEQNGSLMAVFAYLMTLSPDWSGADIRFLRLITEESERKSAMEHMQNLKASIRIPAQVGIILSRDAVSDVIPQESGDSDLVFLGTNATNAEEAHRSLSKIEPFLYRLPTTILIWSNGEADIFA